MLKFNDPDWLLRLNRTDFAQAQALASFSLNAGLSGDQIQQGIWERLLLYPSIQDIIGTDELDNTIVALATNIEPLVRKILSISRDDRNLLDATTRTGMPIETIKFFLRRFTRRLRSEK